jgi:hypothetical protein
MSLYDQLVLNDAYLSSLVNELPNSSKEYDEEAFLIRFEQNLKSDKERQACLTVTSQA